MKKEPIDDLSNTSNEIIPDVNTWSSNSSFTVMDQDNMNDNINHQGLNSQSFGHRLLINDAELNVICLYI